MEKIDGAEFYTSLESSLDAPEAKYGLEGAMRPSAFKVYKDLLKSDGNASFDIIRAQGTWSTVDYDERPFVRKSDGQSVLGYYLMDTLVSGNDDLEVRGRGFLTMKIRSRQSPHHIVYTATYLPPSEEDVANKKRGYDDGWIEMVPSLGHTEAMGGSYDSAVAYNELKTELTRYCGAPQQYRNSAPPGEKERKQEAEEKKKAVSKIGKGENSGTNFRPIKRRD